MNFISYRYEVKKIPVGIYYRSKIAFVKKGKANDILNCDVLKLKGMNDGMSMSSFFSCSLAVAIL